MKTMIALHVGDPTTHEITVYRVLRFVVRSTCWCLKSSRQPEFDLAFALDGEVYVREAGADDAIPWRKDAFDLPCDLSILETFRPEQDVPIRPRRAELPRAQDDAAAADYEQLKVAGLTDGYERDRPRDKQAEKRAKAWRPGDPAWRQQNLDGSEGDE